MYSYITRATILFNSNSSMFVVRDKNKAKNGKNERRGEVLFIDARNIGSMVSRTLKEFSDDEIKDIANVYHSWRGTNNNQYEDKAGFCKVAKTEEIKTMNIS